MGFLSKLLTVGEGKQLKRYQAIVEKINGFEPQISALSDAELAAKTEEFRQRYANGETLDDLLPEAFAVVREASVRTTGLRHFDVQLIGGMALHEGQIAEMKTGEGKTLVSTLAGYLNAIPGNNVHIVTVNDYLARRDCEWMGRIYRFLGMKTGLIQNGMAPAAKKPAYEADITYGTNSEFGFDYLRDNMVTRGASRVQRGHHFAIVDEVDSILIDEARTPLIISGAGTQAADTYKRFARVMPGLKDGKDFDMDEAKKTINATESGLEKIEAMLGIENIYADPSGQLANHLQQALKAQFLFHRDVDYVVVDGEVKIVDEFTGRIMEGRRWSEGLHQAVEAKEHVLVREENQTLATITLQNYFRLYDKLSGMTGTAMTEDAEFRQIYKLPVVAIPPNKPVIRVDENDLIYRTIDAKFNAVADDIAARHAAGQPCLIGTVSIENSEKLSRLLDKRGIPHETLNAKHHEREAHIVARAGRAGAVTIATNMAGRGTDIKLPEEVKQAGGLAIIGTERHESRRVDRQLRGRAGRQGDPGSSVFYVSFEDQLTRLFISDRVAKMIDKFGIEEGEMLESSTLNKAIESAQKRVEENNFGIRKHLLEYDDVMNKQRTYIYSRRHHALLGERIGIDIANMFYDVVEDLVTRYNSAADYDDLSMELMKILTIEPPFTAEEFRNKSKEDIIMEIHDAAMEEFNRRSQRIVDVAQPVIRDCVENRGMEGLIIVPITDGKRMFHLRADLRQAYDSQCKSIVKEWHKAVLLVTIDELWKEHLRELDALRQEVQNATYEQKDPLVRYKVDSFHLFEEMLSNLNSKTVATLMRGQIYVRQPEPDQTPREPEVERAMPDNGTDYSRYRTNKEAVPGENAQRQAASARQGEQQRPQPMKAAPKIGRNDPCPCGSGKKFKNCHGRGM